MASGTYLLVMLIFAAIFAGGLYLAWRGSGDKQIDQGRRSFLGGRGARNDHALFSASNWSFRSSAATSCARASTA